MTRIERMAQVAGFGVRAAVIASGMEEAAWRPVTFYLLVTGCNLPAAVVARVAGCTKQNVSKHLQRIEDLREAPEFDARLQAIEAQLFGG